MRVHNVEVIADDVDHRRWIAEMLDDLAAMGAAHTIDRITVSSWSWLVTLSMEREQTRDPADRLGLAGVLVIDLRDIFPAWDVVVWYHDDREWRRVES